MKMIQYADRIHSLMWKYSAGVFEIIYNILVSSFKDNISWYGI